MRTSARRAPRTLGMHLGLQSEYGVARLIANVVYLAEAADVHRAEDIGAYFNPRFEEHGGHAASVYEGFRFSAFWNPSDGLYGAAHEFAPVTGAQSAQVKAMARVMDKVDRALAAREQADGYTDDYAARLLRVADAIGAVFFVYRPADRAPLQRVTADQVPDVVKRLTAA